MTENFFVATRYEHTITVLELRGEIDAATGPEMRSRLVEIIAEGETELVLDLAGVTFMDSTALGVLISARRRVKALDGYLDLVTQNPLFVRLFHITGLDKLFAIHASVDEALAAH